MDEISPEVIRLFLQGVAEVRALTRTGIYSGYFDSPEELARQVTALDASPETTGIYITLNKVHPALLARRANTLRKIRGNEPTTGDSDILRRQWLPIDIDPVRPSGVSSTEEEHTSALHKADAIRAWLTERGFPEPVLADSGNGAHLLFRVDLPNSPESTALVQRALTTLDLLFSTERVKVDTANHNAARIWRLYGTVSRKGDSTQDRPHRRSRILSLPAGLQVTGMELLKSLGEYFPPEEKAEKPGRKIDLRDFLRKHGIGVKSEKPYAGGTLFVLEECPFSSAHRDGAFAIQFGSGGIFAGCHHASCGAGSQRWRELREKFEPADGYERLLKNSRMDRARLRSDSEGYPALKKRAGEKLPTDPPRCPLTDAGNAERLVARYGEDIRYCAAQASWYLWNGSLWSRDDSGKMLLYATETARAMHAEAALAGTTDEARMLARWAILSESLRSRRAMIDSAAPFVPIAPQEFDARPGLLNLKNGTLDLESLTFRPFCREDMLTRMAGVAFKPSAECPQWKAHLDLIFSGDGETIRGFQAMCGYTLLAENPQQVLFILFGKGRNGKSKTIEVLARMLGNYAVNLAAESLTVRRFETTRSDLARLAGARMATAGEGENGARLAESIIKQITGEYAVTVRRLYENEFEFTPGSKIWFSTNHEPVIRGTDDGIWRRIWMVPFTVQIPEEKQDPDIAAKLLAESPGILNWCLDGLRIYRENGSRLIRPAKVARATSAFRTVSDTIGLFLASECTFEPGAKMSRLVLKEMLEKWCEEEGIRQKISGRRIASALQERGVTDGGKVGYDRFWSGIRLKNQDERTLVSADGTWQDTLFV